MNPVAMALLRRDLPTFTPGGGPPGTGKTFRGAHLMKALVGAELRSGSPR